MRKIIIFLSLISSILSYRCSSGLKIDESDIFFAVCGAISTRGNPEDSVYIFSVFEVLNKKEVSFHLSNVMNLKTETSDYYGYFDCYNKLILIESNPVLSQFDFRIVDQNIYEIANKKILNPEINHLSSEGDRFNIWRCKFIVSKYGVSEYFDIVGFDGKETMLNAP